MLEAGEKVLGGLNIIKRILSPDSIYIAIEDNKEDAIEHLGNLIAQEGLNYTLISIKSKYPMGAEKALVKTVTGREIPVGGIALDTYVVVQNVSTAKAIYDAVIEGKPLIEKVVTVTGAVKTPKNLMVRLGVPLSELVNFCGGIKGTAGEVIVGGPMMGITQYDMDFAISKGANCVLIKEAEPVTEGQCITCGRCLDACPLGLMPTLFPKYAKKGRYAEAKDAYIENCMECGACAYSCPAHIPIVQYIKVAKREIGTRLAKK
jgi:electron transport complex protein RnfC